jgi:hypothetical protein
MYIKISFLETSTIVKPAYLLLQRKDVRNTAIYWILKPSLCLVWHGDCSLTAITYWEMH